MNGQKMADQILSAIKGHIGGVVEMLRREIAEQIKAIELKPGPAGKDGEPGVNGKDFDPYVLPGIVKQLEDQISEKVASIPHGPKGKDGEPGKDGAPGKDADPEFIKTQVAAVLPAMVEKAQAVLAERLDAAVKAFPIPQDGQKGEDGKDALDIEPITNLEKGRSYSRGTWATYKGSLIRAMRTTDAIKDAHPSECGWAVMVEGNSFENATVEYDGKRGFTFKWIKGGREVSEPFTIPCVLDAGFFKEGQTYDTGDGVTFGGSYWIAQKATSVKPEVGSEDWRLAVRKGRDGKRD